MTEPSNSLVNPDKNTILLVSGDLDKALVAFELALAMAAMGKQVNMWFALYGINCLKRPKCFFSYAENQGNGA